MNSDQQDKGLAAEVIVDRDTASRLGITPAQVDAALYASFGQAQVSTMYTAVEPVSRGDGSGPQAAAGHGCAERYLREIVDRAVEVPLASFTRYQPSNTALQVNHQGFYPAVTLSFNLAPDVPLGNAAKRGGRRHARRWEFRPACTAASRERRRRLKTQRRASRC